MVSQLFRKRLMDRLTYPVALILFFIFVLASCYSYLMITLRVVIPNCSGLVTLSILVPILGTLFALYWVGYSIYIGYLTYVEHTTDKYMTLEGDSLESDQTGEMTIVSDTVSRASKKQELEHLKQRTVLDCVNWFMHSVGIVFGGLLIIASVVMTIVNLMHRPTIMGPLYLTGVENPSATFIQREPNGLIHIMADNDHDLFFAQGVAVAQERLFQLDLQRRMSQGRLSEIFGSATLSIDRRMRVLNIYNNSLQTVADLPTSTMSNLVAYCKGINSYIASNPPLGIEFNTLNYEPEPFIPADVISWLKTVSWTLSSNHLHEFLRIRLRQAGISDARIDQLLPDYSPTGPTIIKQEDTTTTRTTTTTTTPLKPGSTAEESVLSATLSDWDYDPSVSPSTIGLKRTLNEMLPQASNNWVIGGQHTASKKPILAGDVHLELNVPDTFVMMHLKSQNINAIGAALVGVPGLIAGRNDYISWTMTNAMADTQDVYIIDKQNADNTMYTFRDSELPYTTRTEVIRVWGENDVVMTVKDTIIGPISNEFLIGTGITETRPIVIRWTALQPRDTTANSFVSVLTSKNWGDFTNSFRGYVNPPLNFLYADVNGNIGYLLAGYIPTRVPEHNGKYPIMASNGSNWSGRIPFNQMPQVFNPPRGYILSANNRQTPPSYPFLIGNDVSPHYRAARIESMIQQFIKTGKKIDLDAVKQMQMDIVSQIFIENRDLFKRMTPYTDTVIEQWRQRMIKWDGQMSIGSQEATMWETFLEKLMTLPGKGANMTVWFVSPYIFDATKPTAVEPYCQNGPCLQFAQDMFTEAVKLNVDILGPNSFRWGIDNHRVVLEHPVFKNTRLTKCMACRYFGGAGGTETVNVGAPRGARSNWDQYFGVNYRQVVDLNSPDSSGFITPLGTSGDFFSSRFDNYLPLWRTGGYLDMKMKDYPIQHTVTLLNQQ